MSTEISAMQGNFEHAQAPDTVPAWLVYREFSLLSGTPGVSVLDDEGNANVVAVQSTLLDNRVLHTNFNGGGCDRSWRVTILELADAKKTPTTISEWPAGVKRANYVYNYDCANFAVMMTDGSRIHYLPLESAASQHIGVIDLRGITGKYHPENETITITAMLNGLRCTITCNRVSGDGTVAFRQPDGTQIESWILGSEESKDIYELSARPTGQRVVGAVATDAYNIAA